MNKVLHGDCLELMKDIPDGSVDMILCDLPYGTTQNKWDSIIDLNLLWEQYNRLIKFNGAIVLFGQDKFSAKMMLHQEKLHRYNLIWKKGERSSGFLNANKMFLRSHEDIMVFYKKLPTYNPQFTKGKPTHKRGKGVETNNNYGAFNIIEQRDYGENKFPKSILDFDRPHPPLHPTQKPVTLFEYLINTYTNEGDLVLDNCAGSFTTAIAALNTKRNYICMEKEQKYFEIGEKRISDWHSDKEQRLF